MSGRARLIPAVRWLRGYRRGFLLGDLAGGLAVGAMLIPQGLAHGRATSSERGTAVMLQAHSVLRVVLGLALAFLITPGGSSPWQST